MKRDVVLDRILSENKLTILIKQLCHIVAFIGDSVNEWYTIKKAHIIVMGKVGFDVAKGATDLLLFDNNYII